MWLLLKSAFMMPFFKVMCRVSRHNWEPIGRTGRKGVTNNGRDSSLSVPLQVLTAGSAIWGDSDVRVT